VFTENRNDEEVKYSVSFSRIDLVIMATIFNKGVGVLCMP
jgi:hypothetical protein